MMTTNRTNSGLAPRRWRRDPDAERELLALLDADPLEGENAEPPQPGAGVERVDDQASGRGVFPLELMNR